MPCLRWLKKGKKKFWRRIDENSLLFAIMGLIVYNLLGMKRKDERSMNFGLKGRPLVFGAAHGTALVSRKPLSFLGGVDPETGFFN